MLVEPLFLKSSLELGDQPRQRFRLFIRGEMPTGQLLDPEAECAQAFLCKFDLPAFKGIFLAAADQERKLIAISLEELAEIEPVALCIVVSRETGARREVEAAIMAIYALQEFANLIVRDLIASRPHHACHHLGHSERAAQTSTRPFGKAAQHGGGVPRVGVSTWSWCSIS